MPTARVSAARSSTSRCASRASTVRLQPWTPGTAREYERYGFDAAQPSPEGHPRVEVAGAYVEFHPGDPGNPERPLLNHLAVLVDSAEAHRDEAEQSGIEVADFVDAANTLAVFVWLPEHVKLEYVEHKPTFSLA